MSAITSVAVTLMKSNSPKMALDSVATSGCNTHDRPLCNIKMEYYSNYGGSLGRVPLVWNLWNGGLLGDMKEESFF